MSSKGSLRRIDREIARPCVAALSREDQLNWHARRSLTLHPRHVNSEKRDDARQNTPEIDAVF
ncbi:MAG TPA: hypothetical protein DCQ06_12505 [Myxococcales bacterium]|nr:hypothetical protein [Myxococcales bacterium]